MLENIAFFFFFCIALFSLVLENILKNVIISQFLILVRYHQDPRLGPKLSTWQIRNSVQRRRHIKYKGLCKLNSTTILQWKGFFTTYLYILNWIFLFNVTARLKICPHIPKSSLLFFFFKYKNQRICCCCHTTEKAAALSLYPHSPMFMYQESATSSIS